MAKLHLAAPHILLPFSSHITFIYPCAIAILFPVLSVEMQIFLCPDQSARYFSLFAVKMVE